MHQPPLSAGIAPMKETWSLDEELPILFVQTGMSKCIKCGRIIMHQLLSDGVLVVNCDTSLVNDLFGNVPFSLYFQTPLEERHRPHFFPLVLELAVSTEQPFSMPENYNKHKGTFGVKENETFGKKVCVRKQCGERS